MHSLALATYRLLCCLAASLSTESLLSYLSSLWLRLLLNIDIATETKITFLINLLDLVGAHYAASKSAFTPSLYATYYLCLVAVMKADGWARCTAVQVGW